MTDILNFTQAAAEKVRSLIVEEGNLALNLRVFISGGGCSGFEYGFTFDESIAEDDTVVSREFVNAEGETVTVNLLVDMMSLQYLKGAEIDYQMDASGEQFVIRNPNAKTTCGCGSSFSPEDASSEDGVPEDKS